MPVKASSLRVGVMSEWLGVAGSISCYLAMFPLAVVGMAGLAGISVVKILPLLNAYMASSLFNLILILSIALLVLGVIRGGLIAVVLSLIAGAAIFVSMSVYPQAWLFLLALLTLAGAELISNYRHAGRLSPWGALLSVLPLAIIVTILGFSTYRSPTPRSSPGALPPDSAQMQRHRPLSPQTPTPMPMQMP